MSLRFLISRRLPAAQRLVHGAAAAVLTSGLLLASGCSASDNSAPVVVKSAPTATPATSAAPSPVATATTDPYADAALIDHVQWTDDPDGRRLHVYPTPAGRADQFPTAENRAWGEVLAAAPDADSPGMFDQFLCHWQYARVVAPNKPSWNLEPWRPAVGYQATVAAACNPGTPDPGEG